MHVFKMVSIFRQRPHPMALGFKGVSLASHMDNVFEFVALQGTETAAVNQLTKLHLRNVPSSTHTASQPCY